MKPKRSWVVHVLLTLPLTLAVNDVQYECGEHGRFEYCIDGIPGCVIGCHCHPGYYFDTDTKICEPNIKLTQEYRRQYFPEPTRTPIFPTPSVSSKPTSTTNILDQNVDAIARDADDLGDWLYNQFFKTIENQVINNTENEQSPTRRSGSDLMHQTMPQRRNRKSRKKSKQKKMIKKGLKHKLLRITEDDSVFDSSSGSSSSEFTSSSSESDSSSDTNDKNDREHGHRKIIMINKKPAPPLPSFIFLPNMDTPFYPPIGLPPPPIIPMYPMVPVPPVGPMIAGIPKCEEDTTTSSTTEVSSTHTSSSDTTTSLTTAISHEPTSELMAPDTKGDVPETTSQTAAERSRHSVRKGYKRNQQRAQFLQKLREKMKGRFKRPPIEDFEEQFKDEQSTYLDEPMVQEPQMYNHIQRKAMDDSKLEDVKFKYLAELIHKANMNQSSHLPHFQINPTDNMIDPQISLRKNIKNFDNVPFLLGKPTPRQDIADHQNNLQQRNNDSYYTNLGRQIASLIRNIDSQGEREINIEVEQTRKNPPVQTFFNENRFSPQSYWERSVRSPLSRSPLYSTKFDFRLVDSNEKLISIEDKANVAATTTATLTLQELESIVSILEQKRYDLANKHFGKSVSVKSPDHSLNINLLQNSNRKIDNNRFKEIQPAITKNTKNSNNRYIFTEKIHQVPPVKQFKKQIVIRHKNNETSDVKPQKNKNNVSEISINNLRSLNLWRKSFSPLHRQVSKITNKNVPNVMATQNSFGYQLNPIVFHSNFNNKQYQSQINIPDFANQVKKPKSYFHHELHHFDYFD